MSEFRVPIATYRLQLNSQFKFTDARAIIPYLQDLGITDIYASPVFKAKKGSLHGYDQVDPAQLNPELGTESDWESLTGDITGRNMGLLLDIVPNHLAMSEDNPFWMDVLENGRDSRYSSLFDIIWEPCEGEKDKILLPVLGKPFGQALEDQEIVLSLDDDGLFVRYGEMRLPLSPVSVTHVLLFQPDKTTNSGSVFQELRQIHRTLENGQRQRNRGTVQTLPRQTEIDSAALKVKELLKHSPDTRKLVKTNIEILNGRKGNPPSFDRLEALLDQQNYRLAFWRTGRNKLNYRRFFNIDSLIGVRTELPEVMEITHALTRRLVQDGKVTGLRIDHIDGLHNPAEYLQRLQRYFGRFYVVVEKILSGNEILPGDWEAYGTTGYDFARAVNEVFIDNEGMEKLEDHYARMIQKQTNFRDTVYESKKKVIRDFFYSETHRLGCRLNELAAQDRYGRDLSERDITDALIEVTACLPIYRTYINSYQVKPIDRGYLETAFQEARRRNSALEDAALNFLHRVLTLDLQPDIRLEKKEEWLKMVMRWQQLTGPVTAKGQEDTALYKYNRLVSLNVIGVALDQGADFNKAAVLNKYASSVEDFHRFNIDRQAHWPVTLNATSTHDTKRSEDVQARINVISEKARPWTVHLSWWRRWNYTKLQEVDGEVVPDPNTEEMVYQALIGSWPLVGGEVPGYKERFKSFLLKAVRESKTYTDWVRPNLPYEKAVLSFIDAILVEEDKEGRNEFLIDFRSFQKEIAFFGALNSLSQTLLKIASPGVPDFYQGMELWDFSLVDPDNRHPVDYNLRQQLLSDLIEKEQQDRKAMLEGILDRWQDGCVMLYLTFKALNQRRLMRELFRSGDYLPLAVEGKRGDQVIAFARRFKGEWAVIVAPRLYTRLVTQPNLPLGKRVWGNDYLKMPQGAPREWLNILTGQTIRLTPEDEGLPLAALLEEFPVAMAVNPLPSHP
jgi:(1->4)-alpha-D-glucan 1-alpha-D-glucosylmutase